MDAARPEMRRRRRLQIAVFLLIAAGVVVRFLFSLRHGPHAPQLPVVCIFLGLLIAQGMLLGLWGGYSRQSPGWRLIVVALAMFFLWSELTMEVWSSLSRDDFIGSWLVFIIPVLATLLGAVFLKNKKAELRLLGEQQIPTATDTLQFEIRSMFVATTIMAVLMTGGMAMKRFFESAGHSEMILVFVVFALMLAVAYPLTALVGLWAALGLNRPLPRLLIVAAVALTAALAPLVFVPFDMEGGTMYVSSCLLQSAVVVAVLLVARSTGYRLIPTKHAIEKLSPSLVSESPAETEPLSEKAPGET